MLFVISVVATTQYSPEAPTGGKAVQRQDKHVWSNTKQWRGSSEPQPCKFTGG